MTDLSKYVKPLEWILTTTGFEANSLTGKYEVYPSPHPEVWLWRGEHGIALDQYDGKEPDGDAAKAAAQAHHDSRILSDIDLDAAIADGVREGLRMGAAHVADQTRRTLNDVSEYEAGICCDHLHHLATDSDAIAEAVARVKGEHKNDY